MVGFYHAGDWATCVATLQEDVYGDERAHWSKATPNSARLAIVGGAGADSQSAALRTGHTTGRLRFSILSTLPSRPPHQPAKASFGTNAPVMQENTGRVCRHVMARDVHSGWGNKEACTFVRKREGTLVRELPHDAKKLP